MIDWIRGWWITFQIWRHDRDTYRYLAEYRYNPDDMMEAPRP